MLQVCAEIESMLGILELKADHAMAPCPIATSTDSEYKCRLFTAPNQARFHGESWSEANEIMPCILSQPQKLEKSKRPQDRGQKPTHEYGKQSNMTRGGRRRTQYIRELPDMEQLHVA